MLWERHAKMGEYDFDSHCFYYFKRWTRKLQCRIIMCATTIFTNSFDNVPFLFRTDYIYFNKIVRVQVHKNF